MAISVAEELRLPVLGWCLYYSDGSIVHSDDSTWEDAPSEDVQVLEILHEAPYRTLFTGWDVYDLPGSATVKYGRWMENTEFYALLRTVEGT